MHFVIKLGNGEVNSIGDMQSDLVVWIHPNGFMNN